jgi:hypothetical protein
MMGDLSSASTAISNLIGVAESKTSNFWRWLFSFWKAKKTRTYIRKETLKLMKKLVDSVETPVDLKEQVAIAWGKLLKRGKQIFRSYIHISR